MAIVKKKISEYIIDEVKRMIQAGTYKEGDKLPDQLSFATQLGVSRSSLREAFQTLEMMGVIKQTPKNGTVIINGNPKRWVPLIQTPLYLDTEITNELLQARRILEYATAEIMITRITNKEIKELESTYTKMGEAYKNMDIPALSSHDFDFHICLAKSTNNRYIVNMYMNLFNHLAEFIEETFLYKPEVIENSLRWHRKIIDELKKEDKSYATQVLKDHIISTEGYYYEYSLMKNS